MGTLFLTGKPHFGGWLYDKRTNTSIHKYTRTYVVVTVFFYIDNTINQSPMTYNRQKNDGRFTKAVQVYITYIG